MSIQHDRAIAGAGLVDSSGHHQCSRGCDRFVCRPDRVVLNLIDIDATFRRAADFKDQLTLRRATQRRCNIRRR